MSKYALLLAWLIACCACSVSLYYGEILNIEPCRLCWYQRIALFPLAMILGIGLYRGDRSLFFYALPLAAAGALAALYQVAGMHYPSLAICEEECAHPIFLLFGFLTFPDLSFLGFTAILYLLLLSRKRKEYIN